ncbi:MAG: sigma-70 family RNA polymerase sigma factor, partial [Myxococcales bacterium]|nr:sigma-70 family RNA polymerase sigma factor [Myxococcales bacterium]
MALDLAEDRKLLEAFRRGDAPAIEQVYREHVERVTALLRRGFSFQSDGGTMTFRGYDNAWDLECAVQDTFAQAFAPSARAAYDGISPYAPYLLRIARNRVISEMRSLRRERRRRDAFAEAPREQPTTPERLALQSELAELVERFRSRLDDSERRFLELRWGDELPLLEVARQLGLSRMRARTREKKIRARF